MSWINVKYKKKPVSFTKIKLECNACYAEGGWSIVTQIKVLRCHYRSWVFVIYCESGQSARCYSMVQITHFHSKLRTPKRLVLLGGSTYVLSCGIIFVFRRNVQSHHIFVWFSYKKPHFNVIFFYYVIVTYVTVYVYMI